MARHLIYHVYPVDNDAWRENVNRLLPYWNAFTGRKIVSVALDRHTTSASNVAAAFPAKAANEIEWKVRHNDPHSSAGLNFLSSVRDVFRDAKPSDSVFYAHAKGVTQPQSPVLQPWIDRLYRYNLTNPAAVDDLLRGHWFCGALKLTGGFKPLHRALWHYAGAFFWFRVGPLRVLPWDQLSASRYGLYYGVEEWPSCLAFSWQAACLYGEQFSPWNLYAWSEDDWLALDQRDEALLKLRRLL